MKTRAEIASERSENFRLARIKAAEFYKSDAGRKIRKEQALKIHENRSVVSKVCVNCKEEFKTKEQSRKYCSDKCKSAYRRLKCIDNIDGICAICEKKFSYNKYSSNLTCSKKCLVSFKNKNGHFSEGFQRKDGYITISRPGHPNARIDGKILEHIFIMSEYLGRPLTKKENVHHKNGIRDDNRIENLELWSKKQPAGQRVEDKIIWAKEFLEEYGFKIEKIQIKNTL